MTKPQELVALEARLEAAEKESTEAWIALMPKQVLQADRVKVEDPTDAEIERWDAAKVHREALRRQHEELVDRLAS